MSEELVRVLLIEDNPGDVRMIRELLAEAGAARFEVTSVDCLAAGLEHLSERSADLLLLDLALPDSQGLDTLATVRARAPEVPIVVLTGLDDEARALRAVRDGAQDFLVKGRVDGTTLAHAMRYALERKRIEERLRESEAQSAAMLECAMDCIVAVNQDGNVTTFNAAAERTFGYRRDDVIGKRMTTLLIPPAQRERHRAGVERYRATGQSAYLGRWVEQMAMRADGTEFPVELSVAPVSAFAGSGFVGVLRDITERKRAEEARLAAEARYRMIFDRSPDGIVIIDPETTLPLDFNDTAHRQLGYSREEFSRLRISDYEAVETPEETKAHVEKALREGRADFETRHRTKQGELRNVVVTAQTLELSGRPVFYCVFRDVTERKRAEEALRASERQYETVVQNSNDWIWTLDRQGNFTFFNRRAEVGSGEKLADWMGKSFAPLIHPDDQDSVVGMFQRALAGEAAEYAVRVRTKRGEIVLSVNTAPLYERGEIVGTVSFGRDITEQRALEDRLRQAQKMEEVGQLAGGIAHDFNNLLTTILATTELLSGELSGDSKLADDVRTVRRAAEHGAGLTRKLLAFARRQPVEMRSLDLGDLIRDVSGIVRRLLPEDIELRLGFDEAALPVRADPGALEQILINLVTNARDAMPGGGSLVIQAHRSTLDREFCGMQGWGVPGEYVILAVTDTGTGMDHETQRCIFEPFFTTKPLGTGTGLGMAVVYGLVKQHQGYIHVYSEVGQGTTIRIYLPAVAEAAGGPVSRVPAAPVRGGTETVLLVEDDESLRQTTKRVLEKYGYTVLLASDGADALDLFRAREADIALIVSDVVMPRLGGPQLLAELRRAGKAVKVLFTSGYTARDVEETKALEAGVPFLSKPWTIPDLLRRVREVLDG